MEANETFGDGTSQHRASRPGSCRGSREAILSYILPPAASGRAAVLERLLRTWEADEYCLITAAAVQSGSHNGAALPGHTYLVSAGWALPVPRAARLRRVALSVNCVLRTVHQAKGISRILNRESCRAIAAGTGDLIDLPARFLASRWAGIPFHIYVLDDHEKQRVASWARRVATRIMPYIMKRVAGVIVTNESLRDEYVRRYDVEAAIVRNPCDCLPPLRDEAAPWPEDRLEIKIVYTGSIYGAHLDAFADLIGALRKLERSDISLHVYTSQVTEELAAQGLSGPVEIHEHVSREAVRQVQRRSDLLFLPLAFDPPYAEGLIEMSGPGKMAEYLASGRPILIHAPADSFVCQYFKTHQCGVVVDRNEIAPLAEALEQLLDQARLRERVVRSARERALADSDLDAAQRTFRGVSWPEVDE